MSIINYLKDEHGLTDEQVLDILSLWEDAGQLEDVQEEFDRTGELRDAPMPTGRSLGGRIFVAANPLEFASTLGERLYGEHRARKLDEERDDIRAEQVRKRQEFFNLLSGRENPSEPATAAAAMPPPAPMVQPVEGASSAAAALRRAPTPGVPGRHGTLAPQSASPLATALAPKPEFGAPARGPVSVTPLPPELQGAYEQLRNLRNMWDQLGIRAHPSTSRLRQ